MIFGKRRPRHPLEPIQEPIRLSGQPTAGPSDADVLPDRLADGRHFAPHCDQRILHAPGQCWACDLYPDWQELRVKWGIDFTGRSTPGKLPCPADYHRPPNSPSDHRQWGPNRAQGARRG